MIISNLKKQIGALSIDIHYLKIEQGKIHGLLGGNGCGKSTLAKLLIEAMPLDSGSIDLESASQADITLMSQRPYLLQRSVYENLIYPLEIRKLPIDAPLIEEWLKKINLWERKDQYARSLSSGEQQKISFLRSLIFHPKIVIIDETLSNLDPESLHLFENWIKQWQEQEKITWIIISHQLIQINHLCDCVHFMQKGRIIESGAKNDIIFNPQDANLKHFIECQLIRNQQD